ncbi:MAG: TIGR00289 family protein [Candidatus Aenigmarchaeota archaeon]|nr:TIGR00289 family protein [Candidatus Aenigmarchaeota archaeon]
MKLAALLSGGKDSMYAMYQLRKQGHEIVQIVSMLSENPESYMFHVPNVHLVAEQAKLLGLPVTFAGTKGEKELELEDLKNALLRLKNEKGIEGVVTGAVASRYQKQRIDKLCKEAGLESLAPLWFQAPKELLINMIKDGFEIMIVAVGAPPLDESWLGRIVDYKCVGELVELNMQYGIHVTFEGGEAESFVLNCPMFSKRIIVEDSEKKWDQKTRSGVLLIKKIRFEDKSQL